MSDPRNATPDQRAGWLEALPDEITENRDELAELADTETALGRPTPTRGEYRAGTTDDGTHPASQIGQYWLDGPRESLKETR